MRTAAIIVHRWSSVDLGPGILEVDAFFLLPAVGYEIAGRSPQSPELTSAIPLDDVEYGILTEP